MLTGHSVKDLRQIAGKFHIDESSLTMMSVHVCASLGDPGEPVATQVGHFRLDLRPRLAMGAAEDFHINKKKNGFLVHISCMLAYANLLRYYLSVMLFLQLR